jgi:hypothetical protein
MSANGISTLSTKEARQKAKLDLAKLKREGYTLANDGAVISGPNTAANFYRSRNDYDITELPTQYSGNTIIDNANTGGLVTGRPWIVPTVVLAGAIIMETGDDLLLENGDQIYTET